MGGRIFHAQHKNGGGDTARDCYCFLSSCAVMRVVSKMIPACDRMHWAITSGGVSPTRISY